MNLTPFDFERPLVSDSQGPLGIDRPLVQPERASFIEHHVTRDSAARVAYKRHLKTEWKRMRLEELYDQLENAESDLKRLKRRYGATPLALQQDRIADKIYKKENAIDDIEEEIEDVRSGKVRPPRRRGQENPEKLSIYEIEDGLPHVLFDEIAELGITEKPSVQGKAQEVVIVTNVSNVTMDTAQDIQDEYEDLGLMVKDVKFR
jgi:hypothetical protein